MPGDSRNPYGFWETLAPSPTVYDYLEVVGRLKYLHPLPCAVSTEKQMDELFRACPSPADSTLLAACGEYARAPGTYRNVLASVKKMDRPVVYDFREKPYYHEALEVVYNMNLPTFSDWRPLGTEEVYHSTTMSAASGYCWGAVGLKSKGDCYNDKGALEFLFSEDSLTSDIVWKVVEKQEWKKLSEVLNGKVRTFIIAPWEVNHWGKVMYGCQAEALKMSGWSAYGFNPFSGGVDKLARTLLRHEVKFYYDVSGWDRMFPMMKEVYELRNSFIPDEYREVADRLAHIFTVSHLILPDGTVIRKWWGNNSGSPNTTTDNILGHELVLAQVLCLYFNGDTRLVRSSVCHLFGDDNVGSVQRAPGMNLEESISHLRDCLVTVFSWYGLTLDPLWVGTEVTQMNFLGFDFALSPDGLDRFVPRYSRERLITSLCYSLDKGLHVNASLSKAYSLLMLSAGNGEDLYDTIRVKLCAYARKYKNHPDPVVRSFCEVGPPSFADAMCFYHGFESSAYPFHLFGGWWNKDEWSEEGETNEKGASPETCSETGKTASTQEEAASDRSRSRCGTW